MSKIDKLKIKGFKSIREATLEFKNINIIIGPNGVGKTNFISFFSFLSAMREQTLQLHIGKKGGSDTFLYFGQKKTKILSGELHFGRNGYFFNLEPTANNSLIFAKETLYLDDDEGNRKAISKNLGSGHSEALMPETAQSGKTEFIKSMAGNFIFPSLESWRVYHFHDTSDDAPVKGRGQINDNLALRSNGANLAAFLYRMKSEYPKNYKDIRMSIQSVAPFFEDFILRPNPLDDKSIQLEWKERGSDIPFLAHQLSDGTLRFILLVTLLLQPDLPESVIIDEPELGLHPFAINFLSSLIKSVSKDHQIILSTQSVTILNQFDPEDIIVVERDSEEEQTVFRPLSNVQNIEAWPNEYSLGDLWEKNWIGGRP